MNNSVLIPLVAVSLLLGGCNSSSKKKTSKTNTTSQEVSSKETVSSTSTTSGVAPTSATPGQSSLTPASSSPETPVQAIEGVFILDPSIEAKVGVKTKTPLVDVIYAEGHSSDEFDNPLTWDTSDHSIAISDQYGRVTASSKGIVTLTCTSVVDNKSASVKVYCYNNESDFEKSWKRMEPTDVLTPGDQLIIACPQYNKAATDDCSGMNFILVMLHSTQINL